MDATAAVALGSLIHERHAAAADAKQLRDEIRAASDAAEVTMPRRGRVI